MTNIKTKSFKHTIIGQQFTCTKDEINKGKLGYLIEDLIESTGMRINRKDGLDLEDFGVEIKSRYIGAVARITVACMNKDEIINTDYKDSAICKKLQQIRIIDYDYDFDKEIATIIEDKVYDFSDPAVQYNIEQEYEKGRKKIANGMLPKRWWEKRDNSYQFRIDPSFWEKVKNRNKNKEMFDQVFTK